MAIDPITFDEIVGDKFTSAKGIEPISPDELFGVKTPTTEVPVNIEPKPERDLPPNILDLALAKHPLTIEDFQKSHAYPSSGTFDYTKEFRNDRLAPVISENFKQTLDKSWKEVNETLGEFAKLTKDPIKFVKGVGDLAFSIPGFLVGIPIAAQRATETAFNQIVLGQTFNLEDVYFEAAKGMQETAKFIRPGVEAVWDKSDKQRELIGAVAMAPLTGLSTLGNEIAEWKGFKDYPNIRGAARFAGDIAGFLSLGAMYGRGRKMPVAAKVKDAAKKAEEIKTTEEALEYVPEDAMKRAKEKTLEIEKRQLELEIEELKKKIDLDAEVKKDLRKKGKKVKEIKEKGIETEAIREERLKYAEEKAGIEEGPTEVEVRKDLEGVQKIEPLEGPPEIAEPKAKVKKVEPKIEEPIIINLRKIIKEKQDIRKGMRVEDLDYMVKRYIEDPLYHSPSLREELSAKDVPLGYHELIYVEHKSELSFAKGHEDLQKIDLPRNYLEITTGDLAQAAGYKSFRDIPLNKVPGLANKAFALGVDKIEGGSQWRAVNPKYVRETKPITDLDRQTGTSIPSLEGEQSPFFQSKKTAEVFRGIYERKEEAVSEDIEVFSQKLINDVNRWYHGDESIDITKTRNDLSGLAARAYEARMSFINEADFNSWKETVSEAAAWARRIEPGRSSTITLYRATSPTVKFEDVFDTEKLAKFKPPEGVKGEFYTSTREYADYFRETYGKDAVIESIEIPIEEAMGYKVNPDEFFVPKDRLKIERRESEGTKLYSGLPLDEAGKLLIKGAKRAKSYVDYARGTKKFKPKEAAKALNKEFKRSFIDRSGNIRLELLNKLGDVGYKIIQKAYLTRGAYALAADKLRQMRKEVYGGLSRKEKQVLDNLILYGRLTDIMKYKLLKNFKVPIDPVSGEQLTIADIVGYTELFEGLEKIPSERAQIIRNRVKGYYEWMKKPLKDMLDAELISKEEYDLLSSHNYRRIKLVDIFDKKYQAKIGKRSRTIYDSGIEALSKGRKTDIYEPSSEIMALEVFNRAYGRILNNEANLSLLELSRNDPKNPFVRTKIKGETIPSGWQRFFVYEKGERKSIYLSPDMAKEWITNNPEISYRMGQFLRYASLSPILRTFATGINWGFALANLPRDIMHIYFAARYFDGKEWKGIYSPHLPIYLAQMGRDLATVFPDAIARGPRYRDYVERGGGMEFLVHQGRIIARGRRLEGPFDKIQDFLGYFGETTELASRLAIKERVTRNRIKEGMKEKDAKNEGTFAARDYMDFGQGGGITKAMDNALPYLNASVQGTRGLWRVAAENPRTFAYKVIQLGTVVTLLYNAMRKDAPETTEALQGSIDMQNNLCIPLGDDSSFEDREGQTRYIYWKIPLDPSQKFFKAFFEGATDKMLGNEVDVERLTNNMMEQSPVGITNLPPTISGSIGYLYNKDLWRNKDIWTRTKPFDWPRSKEEYIPGKTPQFYTDIGKVTGLSPERAGRAIEEVTTGGTMWSYLMGKGYERLLADIPEDQKKQHLAMVLSKIPIAKRLIGVTHPYPKYKGAIKEAEQKVDLDYFIQTRELDRLTEGYLFHDIYERKDIWKYIKTFKEKSIRDRLIERYDFQIAMKDVPERSFWLKLQSMKTPAKAEVYYRRWKKVKNSPEKMKQLNKESAKVKAAGGVFSSAFWDEFSKLRKGER